MGSIRRTHSEHLSTAEVPRGQREALAVSGGCLGGPARRYVATALGALAALALGVLVPAAAQAAAGHAELPAIVAAVRAATGKSGAALYKPLRLALTGRPQGPELAPLLKAMPAGKARERLARFAGLAT